MKIDKKQSIKNKIGIVLVSIALSSTLIPSTALAENFNYTDEQTKVDFIYDDDHVGRGELDDGTYKLVIITNLESGDYVVVGFDQLDEILDKQNDEILVIDDEEFSRESVWVARNSLQEKIDEEQAKKLHDGKISTIIFGSIFIMFLLPNSLLKKRGYGYNSLGYSLKQFVYNIKRGFQEDKSRRKLTKYVKTK